MTGKRKKIKVGITIGDYNGIGPEVIIKTFLDHRMIDFCVPVIYGTASIIKHYTKTLKLKDFNFNVAEVDKAHPKTVNLINVWSDDVQIEPGKPDLLAGKLAVKALETATNDLAHNKIDVLVTAPLNKKLAQSETFNYPGQTEYLAAYSHEEDFMMIMLSDYLRVGLYSTHVPLKDISNLLNKEQLTMRLKNLENTLKRDFGIVKPKIAVFALNPHAGDGGLLGKEESEIIAPAIKELKNDGMVALGPYAADGFFGTGMWRKFDGVMAMYHDQGLAPFKALAFDDGVNFTAGLPVVRTSPDHGTAYDIAGKGLASERSMRNAILTAIKIYRTRREQREYTTNQLKPQSAPNK